MPKLLTKRKHKWVSQRRDTDNVMRGNPIKPPVPVEMRYRAALSDLVKQMADETKKKLSHLYDSDTAEEYFVSDGVAMDASIASKAKKAMRDLWKKYQKLFNQRAMLIAERFANGVDDYASSSVHSSMKQLSGGLSLGTRKLDADTREVMKASIAENVSLIKSIPQKYLGRVEGVVMRSITHPEGRNYLQKELKKSYDITAKRAKFIASDQTRKLNQTVSKGKLQKLGVKKFEWNHVPNSHPRKDHQELDGKIFSWDNPPVINKKTKKRGFPAEEPGCHCEATPVFEFDAQ